MQTQLGGILKSDDEERQNEVGTREDYQGYMDGVMRDAISKKMAAEKQKEMKKNLSSRRVWMIAQVMLVVQLARIVRSVINMESENLCSAKDLKHNLLLWDCE